MSFWNNDLALEFLDLYRNEEAIWDPKHPKHKDRIELSQAWNRISASMSVDVSVDDLKKKKESLMTAFRMHMNRKRTSSNNYHTSWFAFSFMESFLGPKYELNSSSDLDQEFSNNTSNVYVPQKPESDKASRITNTRDESTERKTNFPKKTNSYSDTSYEQPKRYSNIDIREEYDECELYCRLLAKKLQKLDERQRDIAMHEIDNIMFRVKMGNSSSVSYSLTSPKQRKLKSPVFIVTQNSVGQQFEDENTAYEEHMQPGGQFEET